MATTNDDAFSSLDSLGPEYGKINAPVIDNLGLSPFEGNKLESPKINFPSQDRFFPTIPNTSNLDSPQKSVRQNVVGSAPNKPGLNKKASFQDIKNALEQDLRAKLQTNQDKNAYAKVYSYDASSDSNAFYKRYQAYGQEKFDKIGFSPLRDNEALFNAHTTWWDDHKRMMTQSFWPLFGRGFVAGPKSLYKMLGGNFTGTDIEDADAYKEAAAIGQSSKKGFGAFANNTIMNFGYSAGIMSEAILEEIGGALLAPETLGGSFILSTANLLKNTKKAVKGLDMATDGYKAVNSTLDSINNVQSARKFWDQARNLGKMTLSPIGGTVRAYEAAKTADNLTNLGKAYKTAGGFYRDVVRMNMALSEARLEGGMVENQIYDNLYNQYYNKNGEAPGNDLQYDMIKQSKKGALNTVLWNAALIYGSNAIVFPNIMGPKGGIRNFLKNNIDEFATVKGGKYGDFGKRIYNKASKKFEFEANTFKNMALDFARKPIQKSVIGSIGYFKKNVTEGIQENLQEVISGANEKYYSDTFNSKALGSYEYSKAVAKYSTAKQLDYFGEEMGNQFTKQGFETFASGFAMGGLAMPLNSAFKQLTLGYNRMFDKQTYEDFKKQQLKITKGLNTELNNISMQDFLDAKTFNYAVQEGVANVKENGSAKDANDADLEGLINQVDQVLESGSSNLFKEKLRHFSEMTPEEFEEAVPTVPKGEGAKYLAKIPGSLEKIEKIEKKYDYYNNKFPNPVKGRVDPKDPDYENKVSLYHAWNKATQNAVFFNEAFEDTMNRKKSIMEKYLSQAPLKNMSQRDSEVIFDYNKLRNETAMLKDEVATLKELTDPESKKQVIIKQKKLDALNNLGQKTLEFNNYFNRNESASLIRQELQKQKGDVPVTDEEVQSVMNSFYGEATEEGKIKVESEHEAAYKNYLKVLADVNEDYLFDQSIDESYQLLADHSKLGAEGRNLMKYVNLLHDPNGFLENVTRTQAWMKSLYSKRGELYEKMIREQLDIVIDNALLNELANKSIYISLDDFADWQQNGTAPSEFFDHSRKIIIPEGTEAYDQYYAFFEQAAQLKNKQSDTIKESLDESLAQTLNKIDEDMAKAIETVPIKEVKVIIDTLKSKDGVNITLTEVYNKLNPGEFANAIFNEEGTSILVYKDENGDLRLDGKEGEIFKTLNAAIDFTNVEIYTLDEQADPELVAPIKERFESLKNKAREEYADRLEEITTEEEKPVVDFVPVTNDYESLLDYPALYNSLYKSFNEKILSKLSDQDQVNLTEEEELNLFNRFLKTDKDAKAEIDEFNKKKKLDVTTKETGEQGEFEFIYQGNKKSTEEYETVVDLRKIQRRFIALINEIDKKESATTEDMTNKSKYRVLVTQFEKLIATRSRKGLTPELRAAIDKINTIKEKQGAIVITEEGITVNGEEYQSANNALGIDEVKSPFKDYVDEQVKNLFDPEGTPKFDETKITQEAYDNLFGDKGYLTKLKQRVDNGELFIVSQGLTVYDTKSKMASTIDLLVADANSNLTIVAVTPDSKSNWDIFNKKDNPKSKIKQAAMLQTANANLLMSMLGTEAKIAVLPIEMSVSTTDDKILSANKPTSPTLLATDFLIALNKTEAQAEIDKLIPVEKATTTTDTKADIEDTTELTNKELNAGPTAGNQTFNKPVSTKEEIKVYVAGPVLKASEIFWDKNIKTTGSWVPSIQDVGGKSGLNNYIEIEYDSLSEENKKIALELTEEGSFRTFDKSNNVRIVIPGNNLSIEEIQRKSIEIANKFKNQDLLWYTPQTLDEAVTNLEDYKKKYPNSAKEIDAQIQFEKDTWGQNLIGQYFDKATNAIWASKELYDKSKGSPVKITTTDTKADIERRKQKSRESAINLGVRKGWQITIYKLNGAEESYILDKKDIEFTIERVYGKEQTKPNVDTKADIERRRQQNIIAIAGSIRKINGTTDPQLIFTEINKIKNALKEDENIKLSLEDQTFIDKELKDLKDKGYTFKTKKGEVLNPGENIVSEDEVLLKPNEVTESEKILIQKELDKRKISKQEYLDNGYTEEEATLESGLGPNDTIDIVTKDLQVILLKDGVQEKAGKVSINIITIENAELAALKTNVVPADAESSDDVESPAVEAEINEREVVVIDESVRYKISDFKADLAKVTTKEELNSLLADLSIKNSEQLISYEDLQEMATMVKEKANQLNTPQDIKIVPESLVAGAQLVAKNTIFTSTDKKFGIFAETNDTVVVRSIDIGKKTVTVSPLNSTSEKVISFSDISKSFIIKDNVMTATETENVPLTPEDKTKIVVSTDLVDTFVQNKDGRIDQIEETASAKSLEELDEELMKDLEC